MKPSRLFLIVLLGLSVGRCISFDIKLPQFPTWGDKNGGIDFPGISISGGDETLKPGDKVAVVGLGNVGKLVALRLSDTYKVNGIVRDANSVKSFFEGREERIELFETDLTEEVLSMSTNKRRGCPDSLLPALRDANAIVICTGTTAFPTEAWSRSGQFSVTGEVINALLESKFDVTQTLLSLDGRGLNTPKNVDDRCNKLILDSWKKACTVKRKRAVMLSSIGVTRREKVPFTILNACGVLAAKAAGERALQQAATDGRFSYTIVRPGQLFGGPYDNNYYLGTLFQLDKDSQTRDIDIGTGDELLGDTLRTTLAEVTAQILENDCAKDVDFAVVNTKGDVPTEERLLEK